ncbi:MAG: hypothetical protein SGJ10_13830, partial [Bacteroidota bacterium]|nr:hypothetical protein [Bacteroidota bacterium]
MNIYMALLKKIGSLFLFLLMASFSYGTLYTATSSGKYSSNGTWSSGVAPPYTVLLDQIVIQSGITVNLDSDLVISGSPSELSISGTLNTTNNSSLLLDIGTVKGAGIIELNLVNIDTNFVFLFTGSLKVNALYSSAGFQTSAKFMVKVVLYLIFDTISLTSGGDLDVGNNATIIVSGGSLSISSGGSVNLSGKYNVAYTNRSLVTGAELIGTGLNNITMDVTSTNSLTLSSDLRVTGTLSLISGILMLAGKDLIINGGVADTGSGKISSTAFSNIIINTSGGDCGAIRFNGNSAAVNKLVVNIDSGYEANIEGGITITDELQLNSGILNFNHADLVLNGGITGVGYLSGDNSSNLTIATNAIALTKLKFASGGNSINDFTMSVGMGNSVLLSVSDLIVNGTLSLKNGAFDLNGHDLTINGNITESGVGTISSSSFSNVIVSCPTSPTGSIDFTSTADTVGNFTVDIGNGGITTLNSNLYIHTSLNFKKGKLDMGSNALIIDKSAIIKGSGVSSYIITSIKGYIEMNLVANGNYTSFPLGTITAFAPVSIRLNSGATNGQVQAGIFSHVMKLGTTGDNLSTSKPLVDATWHVKSSIANINIDLKVNWPAVLEVNEFNRSESYIVSVRKLLFFYFQFLESVLYAPNVMKNPICS